MLVGLKDASFEASSPIRYATELSHVLSSSDKCCKPMLFMYSDGGPDHRTCLCFCVSIFDCNLQKTRPRLSFAARMASAHSRRNPVECVISTLNLVLQCNAGERRRCV